MYHCNPYNGKLDVSFAETIPAGSRKKTQQLAWSWQGTNYSFRTVSDLFKRVGFVRK
jgi:hypothetical protein